jgi:PBSX family phage terminase large subunit
MTQNNTPLSLNAAAEGGRALPENSPLLQAGTAPSGSSGSSNSSADSPSSDGSTNSNSSASFGSSDSPGHGFRFAGFSPKQKMVLCWWCDASPMRGRDGIIADGAIRSGKSLSLSLSFCLWAMARFSGQNFALCGKTIGSLRRNVLAPLKPLLAARGFSLIEHRTDNLLILRAPAAFARGPGHPDASHAHAAKRPAPASSLTRTSTARDFLCPEKAAGDPEGGTGGEIVNSFYLFGGRDERSQDLIQGVTLAGVLFDEVALMPQSFVNQATARCSVCGSKFWFNCNPEGPEHWFFRDWVRPARTKNLLYLHFTMRDNPSLSPAVRERYRRRYSGAFFDRYILGRWVLAEGLVYPGFGPQCLCAPDPPHGGRWFLSIDYGTRNPFSAGLWQVADGVARRVDEYYYDGRLHPPRTDEEHCTALLDLAARWCPAGTVECAVIDPSAASMVEVLRRRAPFAVRAASNDVLPGIANVACFLADGRLKIAPRCRDCIREFHLYRWDPRAAHDTVLKQNDHAMDDVRYFCRSILRRIL